MAVEEGGESTPLVGFMQRHSNISITSAERLSRYTTDFGPRLLQNEETSSVISSPSTGARSVQRASHAAHLITSAQRWPAAKKLKKDWIAKQKTKSKWKTQKRREGIITQRDASSCSAALSDPHNTPQSSVGHKEQGAPVDETVSDQHGDESQNSSEDEPALTKSEHGQEESFTSAGPSLRELQKQAYSPATLHHYKSRPLHHSKGHMAPHGTRIPESSRKRDARGGSRNLSRRGGQPDMRLRMSAMLEKIKRDYA
jgi:hypothetical protein